MTAKQATMPNLSIKDTSSTGIGGVGMSGPVGDWTVRQLEKRMKELGMSGYSSLTNTNH
jgi:hypothetical protein